MADSSPEKNSYEKQRQLNILANERLLKSLELLSGPVANAPSVRAKNGKSRQGNGKVNHNTRSNTSKKNSKNIDDNSDNEVTPRPVASTSAVTLSDEPPSTKSRRTSTWDGPKTYHPPPIPVLTPFAKRLDASRAGLHAPPMSGIHAGPSGAYSVVLSGGYVDDVDLGSAFTYTGQGGRDPQSGKQMRDQVWTRGNAALKESERSKKPVRVIRGYQGGSTWSPKTGYRYDGLYSVEKAFMSPGLDGYQVCRFAMRRLGGQPKLPRKDFGSDDEGDPVESIHSAPEEEGGVFLNQEDQSDEGENSVEFVGRTEAHSRTTGDDSKETNKKKDRLSAKRETQSQRQKSAKKHAFEKEQPKSSIPVTTGNGFTTSKRKRGRPRKSAVSAQQENVFTPVSAVRAKVKQLEPAPLSLQETQMAWDSDESDGLSSRYCSSVS